MTATDPPTRLMDRKTIARELGLSLAGAETLMRQLRLRKVGRRVYVLRDDVEAWLKSEAKA